MTDFCVICECEPVNYLGWSQIISGILRFEWVCPWCIKEGRIHEIHL